jgi:glutathionylspermidine synthase
MKEDKLMINNTFVKTTENVETLIDKQLNNKTLYLKNNEIIQRRIDELEFSFEDREFPYSIRPLIITKENENYFKEVSEVLLECLEIVLDSYKTDTFVQDFFDYYKDYDFLLNFEQPGRNIVISRFDTVWYGDNSFKIFECNTCCPGGISILGTIKREYLKLPIFNDIISEKNFDYYECDYTESFIRALVQHFETNISYSPSKIGIAFVNYKGFYSYELKQFAEYAEKMGYNTIVCDIEELNKQEDGKLYYKNIEINIIYNKIDQLMLSKELMKNINDVLNNGFAISVNPYLAMFITESKLVLALLQDQYFQNKYLNAYQIELIKRHIPWSRKLEDVVTQYEGENINLIPYIKENKNKFVIKIDNETRGSNIFIGKNISILAWEKLIEECINKNWLVQQYCQIPEIKVPEIMDGNLVMTNKKYGIDFFMYNGLFKGIVSRVSGSDVINVGSGGYEQPVLTIQEGD